MELAGKRIAVSENVLVRELQGESVLLNLDSESYFGLDEVGTRMWAVLTQAPTLQAALEILSAEYEVEGDQLQADLARFVERLREAGLVEVSDV